MDRLYPTLTTEHNISYDDLSQEMLLHWEMTYFGFKDYKDFALLAPFYLTKRFLRSSVYRRSNVGGREMVEN